ncbi:MAG TPA: ADP-glyceromanno-heptose 6-epimerase [Rickettsiales bacterium]|nr:ADP-glyceromanno-heptose 6-epimerase [Rickettsiales bacterium]
MIMQTILITGGAGFIGSNIAAKLCARGTHRVVICDALGSDDKWRNLRNASVYEIIPPGNLFYWLEMYAGSLDAVIHMGAISSTTETNVDLILENNQTLSTLLFRWCAENSKRFIYASSAATYGDGTLGFDDDFSLAHLNKLRPLNPYGWSKHLVDRYIAQSVEMGENLPPQYAGLKFFNVYGPNEYHKEGQKSVVATKFPGVQAGKSATLFKSYHPDYRDGGQMRDFIYVRDCVDVVTWLLDNPKVSGLFNVGTGKARSFDDLARGIFAALGREPQIEYIDMPEILRGKYQYFTEAKMDRLRQAGYNAPFTSLEDGIRDYVQNYLMKEDPYL